MLQMSPHPYFLLLCGPKKRSKHSGGKGMVLLSFLQLKNKGYAFAIKCGVFLSLPDYQHVTNPISIPLSPYFLSSLLK